MCFLYDCFHSDRMEINEDNCNNEDAFVGGHDHNVVSLPTDMEISEIIHGGKGSSFCEKETSGILVYCFYNYHFTV